MIYFGRQELTLPHLKIGESEIECVKLSKLLGLIINNKLTWHDHVEYISSKASCRIYFLCILRWAGKPPTDIIRMYTSVIRSVLEYACEVWHSGLTKEQSDTLEHLQTYRLYTKGEKPNVVSYLLPWKDQTHKLHHLLPKEQNKSNLRQFRKYEPFKTKTERFRKSPITCMLYNYQDCNWYHASLIKHVKLCHF